MADATFEVTRASFQTQVLDSPLPVLVEFTADWCPPCKMLAPTIHALAEQYKGKVSVGFLDADLSPDIVQRYGVMGLPTLILFRGGQEAKRLLGFQPKERVEAMIAEYAAVAEA